MIKLLLAIHLLFASSVLCGDLQFGPRLGMIMPGNINDASNHLGPGCYWGAAAELPLSSLLTMEFAAGTALRIGEQPNRIQDPGFPTSGDHKADWFSVDLALSVNTTILSLAAGPGYYFIHMEWWENVTGSGSEWKAIEVNRIGYHVSLGLHPVRNVALRLALHYPEPGNPWGVLSLTWLPFKV